MTVIIYRFICWSSLVLALQLLSLSRFGDAALARKHRNVFPHAINFVGFPPYQDVLQVFTFTSSGPLVVELQDAFCTGRDFSCWDNGVYLGTTESTLNFCGISASNYNPIIEPQFTKVDYFLTFGYHNFTVLVTQSPVGSGVATLRITFRPEPGTIIKHYGLVTTKWPHDPNRTFPMDR